MYWFLYRKKEVLRGKDNTKLYFLYYSSVFVQKQKYIFKTKAKITTKEHNNVQNCNYVHQKHGY